MNFNSRKLYYKNPFGAVKCGENIRIRFPIADWVNVNKVFFIIRKGDVSTYYDMAFTGNTDNYNIFEIDYKPPEEGIFNYRFEMHNYDGIWYYGRGENGESRCGHNLPEWQLTVYKNTYKTPEFAKGGLIYHIFVDRFFRQNIIQTQRSYRLHESWDELPEVISPDGKYYADDFFGGNFAGIENKLNYLKELGVTIIYLSPVFESFSNHRYDTGDYLKIDELLGDEVSFNNLIKSAEKKNISIILDGVFNHSGADSIYFNKFGRYPAIGAYQSKYSPYYNWYYFNNYPDDYSCWWGCDNVPDLNKNNEGYRHLIFGVGGVVEKWSGFGLKGWRLDVVDELPVDFTYRLCDSIKRCNKDALIIGEVWEDASNKISYGELRPYLLGGQLDGTMNYPFKEAIIEFVSGGYAATFKERVMNIVENYPKESLDCSMTLLGSHDTVRILTELADTGDFKYKSKTEKRNYILSKEKYVSAKKKLIMAVTIQYTLPGIPCVYYGDEAGMQGFEDPLNRAPYPWGKEDMEILNYYKLLGKMRKQFNDAMRGNFAIIRSDDLLIYSRKGDYQEVVTIVNNCDFEVAHTFNDEYVDVYGNTVSPNTARAYSAGTATILIKI